MTASFLFHDYETFGADPARDGIAQFAAIRTDTNLEPVGETINLTCQPVRDRLPHPDACLVTGITPQDLLAGGLPEPKFAARVHETLARPGTCALGYNTIRFDDAFTRHLLWRNFHDPYAREWWDGNSRFDLIDLARLCHALRPEGIEWPLRDDGRPSFRLEHLARANRLDQARAHDALSDVEATIGLARLLRDRQPRLWQFALGLRDKQRVRELLDWRQGTPVLHASEKYGAERGCTALVLPIAPSADSEHGVHVVDLMADPAPLIEVGLDELRDRLYTPRADLPEGIDRPAVKTVYGNRCPMLAPVSVLAGVDLARIGLDPDRCERHRHQLLAAPGIREKLAALMTRAADAAPAADAELSLYRGGFPSRTERARLDAVRSTPPAGLAALAPGFEQERHRELLWRYRGRHFPQTLGAAERGQWRGFVAARLRGLHPLSSFGLDDFHARIAHLRSTREAGPDQAVLDRLDDWGRQLATDWLDD
ncbi:MAG: exodeoxyribonuclease I [Xanthomonadales bacterium]|nr:exodeoxyribonuclease I [Xanthomonadales bacterium]